MRARAPRASTFARANNARAGPYLAINPQGLVARAAGERCRCESSPNRLRSSNGWNETCSRNRRCLPKGSAAPPPKSSRALRPWHSPAITHPGAKSESLEPAAAQLGTIVRRKGERRNGAGGLGPIARGLRRPAKALIADEQGPFLFRARRPGNGPTCRLVAASSGQMRRPFSVVDSPSRPIRACLKGPRPRPGGNEGRSRTQRPTGSPMPSKPTSAPKGTPYQGLRPLRWMRVYCAAPRAYLFPGGYASQIAGSSRSLSRNAGAVRPGRRCQYAAPDRDPQPIPVLSMLTRLVRG